MKTKLIRRLTLLASALLASACYENNGSKFAATSGLATGSGSSAQYTMVISNVTVAAAGGSSSGFTTSIFFDPSSQGKMRTFCDSQSSGGSLTGKVCVCNFSWTENNTSGGTTVPVPRGVQTTALTVQDNLVTCNAPDVWNQILNGIAVQISVLPAVGNGSSFTMAPYSYTKSTSSSSASFQDAQGNSYQDILRYTCYEQYQRGMSVSSQTVPIPNPTTGVIINAPSATQFCVQTTQNPNPSGQGCLTQGSPPDYTSQAYYYNLYIRDSEQGDINFSNDRYHCPLIKEALGNNGTIGTQNKSWPLDRTFALSLGATQTFNIGVEAFTKLGNAGDPTSSGSSCYPSGGATPQPSGSSGGGSTLVSSCLGFGAAPNSDGTCPYFRDSNNNIRLTYHLRRYYVVYPPIFDTDGTPIQGMGQPADTIYVLDRPVNNNNPLAPYTMSGPKPCPFAFFDHAAVTGVADNYYTLTNLKRPGYFGTNDIKWSGKNVDGIQFPNTDSANSCSAMVGLLNTNKNIYSLGTVNSNNPGTLTLSSNLTLSLSNLYIRPVQPWSPHYIEDTSFQACAPQSSSVQDPPLHFARDAVTGTVGWCAEVYPTQNPNVSAVDPLNTYVSTIIAGATYGGDVAPYTSHVVKNTSNADCTPSSLTDPANYPAGGKCGVGGFGGGQSLCAANHPNYLTVDPNGGVPLRANKTCDRTVNSQPQDWLKFPLLAPALDTENAIKNDISSYGCIVTYDNNGTKSGKTSPTDGCCAAPSVTVKTGALGASSAHLEPTVSCATPSY